MAEFNLDLKIDPQMPVRKDWRIGTIGAGAKGLSADRDFLQKDDEITLNVK